MEKIAADILTDVVNKKLIKQREINQQQNVSPSTFTHSSGHVGAVDEHYFATPSPLSSPQSSPRSGRSMIIGKRSSTNLDQGIKQAIPKSCSSQVSMENEDIHFLHLKQQRIAIDVAQEEKRYQHEMHIRKHMQDQEMQDIKMQQEQIKLEILKEQLKQEKIKSDLLEKQSM